MAKKQESKALVKWDEEMAREAEIAAGMENSAATGNFFSLKSGVLAWNDAPVVGNQMGVIILDHILENVYYEGKYNPEEPQGPMCFAFGRDDKQLAPHKIVVDGGTAQSDFCKDCPRNEWGTANVGRGKACRNTRRLAVIAAGNFDQAGKFDFFREPEQFETSVIGFLKLPVTSVKGYAGFVKQIAGAFKRPPHGVITKIKVVPDPKTQFKVVFEAMTLLPEELGAIVRQRRTEAMAVIDFPYTPFDTESAPQQRGSQSKKGRKY